MIAPTQVSPVLALCALTWWGLASAADPQASTVPSAATQHEEVVVSASKLIDKKTLERIVLPRFVKSHGTPSERIGQIGRWYTAVCPETVGLQPAFNEYISKRVIEVARSVGAPTKRAGKCAGDIKIIFSPHPQAQLDYIASKFKVYLGYSQRPSELAKISHSIQAWYVTGTRSSVDLKAPAKCADCVPPGANGLAVDSDNWVMGQAGSYLGNDLRSEFIQVTVIADADALVQFPAREVADYIAMLVLTRTALDGCNPLPSIIDVLSRDCGERSKPQGITEADTSYLKALYSSNLEMKVNLEQGEMRDQMLKTIEGP
ncbi:MAG TPA: hypothetical protein VGM97_13140 [Steroidobacteraceae bacterium]|jgi:hypothetical protein